MLYIIITYIFEWIIAQRNSKNKHENFKKFKIINIRKIFRFVINENIL